MAQLSLLHGTVEIVLTKLILLQEEKPQAQRSLFRPEASLIIPATFSSQCCCTLPYHTFPPINTPIPYISVQCLAMELLALPVWQPRLANQWPPTLPFLHLGPRRMWLRVGHDSGLLLPEASVSMPPFCSVCYHLKCIGVLAAIGVAIINTVSMCQN